MSDTVRPPLIVAFCCHYCAYAAADLAGSMRLSYPPSLRVVKLPCTGKVDPAYILHALERGADGVIVAGCLEGQCHFLEGNLRAKDRVQRVKEMVDAIGLSRDRVEMYNLSSAMGQRFVEIAQEMEERVKRLGPNPLRHASDHLGQQAVAPPGDAWKPGEDPS